MNEDNDSNTNDEFVDYTALFVDDIELLKQRYKPVHPKEYYHHSTIAYRPSKGKYGIEVGKKYQIKIIGRVTTEKVDTLMVENSKSEKEYPHITLSTAIGVKSVESNLEIAKAVSEASFIPLEDLVEVTEGYVNEKGEIVLE